MGKLIFKPDNPQEFSIDDKGQVMNRREQIEEAAKAHTDKGGGPSDTCHNCQVFNWAGFVTGAEWADQNPDQSPKVFDPKLNAYTNDVLGDLEKTKDQLFQTKAALDVAVGALDFIKGFDCKNGSAQVMCNDAKKALARIAEMEKEK